LQSFEVDHEEMTNTLSDAKQNNQRPQPEMQQQSRLLLLSSYTMGLAKDSVAELRLSLHNFRYCDDGLMLLFSGVVDVVVRLVPPPSPPPPISSSELPAVCVVVWLVLVRVGVAAVGGGWLRQGPWTVDRGPLMMVNCAC